MALQVWCPLLGDLHNQGLDNSGSFTNASAVWHTSGKIGGKSYQCSRSSTPKFNNLVGVTNYSVAYWVYIDSSLTFTNYSDMWGIQFTVGSTTTWMRDELRNTNSIGYRAVHMAKDASVGGNTNTYYGLGNRDDAKNKWCHVVIVKDNTKAYQYVNGELIGTWNSSNWESSPGAMTGYVYLGESGCCAYLQDFRIYDHCLTENEVKRLAQGLVLHYPLNRNGWGQENLIPGTSSALQSGSIGQYYSTIYSSSSFFGLTAGDTYTFRIYFKAPAGKKVKARIQFYTDNNNRTSIYGTWVNAGEEGYSIITDTLTSTQRAYSQMQLCCDCNDGTTTTDTYYHKEAKLELGSIATPWCPNSSDALATTMGLNGMTEYDCSGFCNNGTRTGTFSWTSDTPKYCVSTAIEKGIINSTNSFVTTADPVFSVALWFKLKSGVSYTSYTDLISFSSSSYSNQPFRLEICGSPVGKEICWFRGPSGQSGGFGVGSNLSFDTWYHTVLVSEGNKQYTYYLNGEKKGTYNGSANTWTPTGNVSLGENINGVLYESDFRIYATALSADDVKSLYQNCATIGPDGTIYGKIR